MTFISNGYVVPFSRETEKNGRVFKVLQAVDSRAIWMYLARYCNEGHEISHVHSQTYYLAACQVSARSL